MKTLIIGVMLIMSGYTDCDPNMSPTSSSTPTNGGTNRTSSYAASYYGKVVDDSTGYAINNVSVCQFSDESVSCGVSKHNRQDEYGIYSFSFHYSKIPYVIKITATHRDYMTYTTYDTITNRDITERLNVRLKRRR